IRGLILVFLVNAKFKTKMKFNGLEHASVDDMLVSVRAASDSGIGETAVLHSGARLAAKLNAKIILNETEFNNSGEMSVDDRRLYHEALAALFPASIAVAVSEGPERPRWSCLSLIARLLRLKR